MPGPVDGDAYAHVQAWAGRDARELAARFVDPERARSLRLALRVQALRWAETEESKNLRPSAFDAGPAWLRIPNSPTVPGARESNDFAHLRELCAELGIGWESVEAQTARAFLEESEAQCSASGSGCAIAPDPAALARSDARSSFLDYSGRSDHDREKSGSARSCFLPEHSSERRHGVSVAWLAAVEQASAPYREGKARLHARCARLAARHKRLQPRDRDPFHRDPAKAAAARREVEILPEAPPGKSATDGRKYQRTALPWVEEETRELLEDWGGAAVIDPAVLYGQLEACEPPERSWEQTRRQDERDASDRAIKWHRGRERGALERFERVNDCGKRRVRVRCLCGAEHDVPDRCGADRLCRSCKEASRAKNVAKLARAQLGILRTAKREGFLRRHRKGGRWGQRMVTLTIPHVDSPGRFFDESIGPRAAVEARIRLLFAAWRRFSLSLQRWARSMNAAAGRSRTRCAWYRAFEWTRGDDGNGHPHFHVWMFSPFLDRELVETWWREALAAEGVITSRVIVDVRAAYFESRAEVLKGKITTREAKSGQKVAEYIQGWTILDAYTDDAGNVREVDPEVIARLYAATDGRQLNRPSHGLLERSREGCSECGGIRTTKTEVYDPRIGPSLRAEPCGAFQGLERYSCGPP